MTNGRVYESVAEAGAAYLREYTDMYPRERGPYGFFPFGAAYMGIHDGDGSVTDYRPESVARRLIALDSWAQSFELLRPLARTADDLTDLAILTWVLDAEVFALRVLQPHRNSPLHYNDTIDVSGYIRRNYAPLPDRLRGLLSHLQAIPEALSIARANLQSPLPRVDLRQAIRSFSGHVTFLETDMLGAVRAADHAGLTAAIEAAAGHASRAIRDFVADLESREVEATDDFALGTDRFLGLLRSFEMVDLSLDELRAAGMADLSRNKTDLQNVCREIDPHADVREIMDRIQAEHPAPADLHSSARSVLGSLRDFVVSRDLVSIASDIEPVVAETPSFHRWSFASMDATGVFEDEHAGAYFFVTSPEPWWSPEQQEQWMRRFFHASIVNTSAHEVYPGHYVQSQHKRRAATDVQKAFDSFTHWEAWAHYSEQMLLDEGYGEGEPTQRVAQLFAALLRTARFNVAIGMHCDGMTIDDATTAIMDATYMDELPARREAERGTFDPGYGNYMLGKLMLIKLRRDAEIEWGERFSLREFHDRFLSFGAPPFPIVRSRMLTRDDGRLL